MESQPLTVNENIIITWFNDSQMGECSDIQQAKDQLKHNNVGILSTFDDADECINFIGNVKDYRIILVLGPLTGAKVLRKVLHISQLKAVFIVCPNQSMRPPWATQYKAIKCITVDSTSICQQIEIVIADSTVGIDILDSSIISTDISTNQNKPDVRFMYSQLLKYVLTKMVYSNDDTNDMIEFFENKFKDQSVTMRAVREFRDNYEPSKAIWCYTSHAFLYKTLNSALRTYDICALYSMRVFLKDLHLQIVKLYTIQQTTEVLKLYKGLVIPTLEFEKIKEKTGKLLSFTNFLSTSANKDVALMFASSPPLNETAFIFEITIDPSMLATVAFTSIQKLSKHADEDEYLFTMGSIFRIESIERLDGNPDWCIHLTLTTDHDPEIAELTKYMQSEFKQPSIHSLCTLLIYMGEYNKAIDILNVKIKSCKIEDELCRLYKTLGITYVQMGNFQSALEALQSFYEHLSKLGESEYDICEINLVTCLVNMLHGKLDLVLANIETIKQNEYKLNTRNHEYTENFAILDMLKGYILERQGHCVDALKCQTEAYNMLNENLPSMHPSKIGYLFLIGMTYEMNNQADDASLCMQQVMEIQRHSLPREHFLKIFLEDIYGSCEDHKHDDLPSDYSITDLSDYIKNPARLIVLCTRLMKNNKWDEALLVLNQYIKFHEEHSTIQNIVLGFVYYYRGICYKKKKYLTEALKDYKQSYEIGIQHFGVNHDIILKSLVSTAEIYVKLDNYDQALIVVEKCKNLIATSPQLSSTDRKKSLLKRALSSFKLKALEQYKAKEYEKALLGFQNCLKIQIYVLSDDHLEVGETYQWIARTYKKLENDADALYNYEKAQSILEKYLPFNDSNLIDIWNDLRFIYFRLKQYDDALFACTKYLWFQKNTLPLRHIDIAKSYTIIANIHGLKKSHLNTIENSHRALIILLEHLPETCFETIETLDRLGYAYMKSHQYEESLMAFYECLEYQLNVLPSDHMDVLKTYKAIALLYWNLERYEEAFQNFESCLFIEISLLPSIHSDIVDTQSCMGEVAIKLNNLSLAASCYECVLDIRRKHLPTMNVKIVETWEKLGHLYAILKRDDDSQRAFEECRNFELSLQPSNLNSKK